MPMDEERTREIPTELVPMFESVGWNKAVAVRGNLGQLGWPWSVDKPIPLEIELREILAGQLFEYEAILRHLHALERDHDINIIDMPLPDHYHEPSRPTDISPKETLTDMIHKAELRRDLLIGALDVRQSGVGRPTSTAKEMISEILRDIFIVVHGELPGVGQSPEGLPNGVYAKAVCAAFAAMDLGEGFYHHCRKAVSTIERERLERLRWAHRVLGQMDD